MSISLATFEYVRGLVRREAGIVLETGKEYLVEARLFPLAREAGLADVDAYVQGVQRSPARPSLAKIVDALTTNETSWMRDGEPFQALVSDVLPVVLGKPKVPRVVNIWSAACSSGQEPYGISMISSDLLKGAGWRADILASDISLDMLQKAQAGVYSQLEVNRGLPATLLVKHFTREGAAWKIADDIRRSVRFQQVNLTQPFPSLPLFDVIFLRNVLIYFDTETKRQILQRMHSVLAPDGFLFLGSAETTLGVDDQWERVKVGRTYAHRPKGEPRRTAGPAATTAFVPTQKGASSNGTGPSTSTGTTTGVAGNHFGGARVQ